MVSHPIQYHAPLYRLLSEHPDLQLRVFFTWNTTSEAPLDRGFEKRIRWDVPLLDGYEYEFVPNEATDPGTHHFRGLVNPSLMSRISAWRPDVIVVNGYNYQSHLHCIRASHRRKIPILFRGDSHLLTPRPWAKRWVKRVALRTVFSWCRGAMYCGAHNKEYFLAHGVAGNDLYFCPHAVDNDRFMREQDGVLAQSRRWRSELGIPQGHKVVLFAGKFQRKKGPHILLESFSRLDNENVVLLFVGNGELEQTLREKGARLGSKVVFLPFQNQSVMPVVYRLGDVFVLPSLYDETWGLAVNEAMCCGVPVLLSPQVGCAPDLVEKGVTGWVTETTGVDALAECLNLACSPDADLGVMGEAARKRIRSWDLSHARDFFASAAIAVSRRRLE